MVRKHCVHGWRRAALLQQRAQGQIIVRDTTASVVGQQLTTLHVACTLPTPLDIHLVPSPASHILLHSVVNCKPPAHTGDRI